MKTNYNKHLATQKHLSKSWILQQVGGKVQTAEEIKQKQKPKTKQELLEEIQQLKDEIERLKKPIL
jgi:hypothetical protein